MATDPISNFIARCDAYCARTGRSRSWLSKALMDDTDRLEKLAEGTSADVGARRLQKAEADLDKLFGALEADKPKGRRREPTA